MANDDTKKAVKRIFTEYLEKKVIEKLLRDMQYWMRFTREAAILI